MTTDRNFVWAIDENGKPCKCYALPENRGKGRCNHYFHAAPGESSKDFFKKYGLGKQTLNEFKEFNKNKVIVPELTREDLPDYTEGIKALVSPVDSCDESVSDAIYRSIYGNKRFMGDKPFDGAEIKVTEEIQDPDDPNKTKITMTFTKEDGTVDETSFSVPRMTETGEYIINGTAYRYIPTLKKDKSGVCIGVGNGGEKLITFKDEDEEQVVRFAEGKDVCSIHYVNEDGKHIWDRNVSVEDVKNYFDGKDNNLTDEQKAALASVSPIVTKRWAEEGGIDGLMSQQPDSVNDLSYKGVVTFNDRLVYSFSKKFRSMDSFYRKAKKNGDLENYKFDTTGMEDVIRKDMNTASYMQVSDNLNPIAAMSQSQKVSWTGEGGDDVWSNDNPPDSLRMVNKSYFGMSDVNDTPLGGKVGLTVNVKGRFDHKTHTIIPDKNIITGSDFIPYINHSDPTRSAMAISQMKEACPIVGGEDPKVSTKGWDKIKGSKLGCNLNVAYVAEEGVWEDAVVISESTAKKMTTVQSKKYNVPSVPSGLKVGDKLDYGSNISGVPVQYPGVVKSIDGHKVEIESVYPMTVGDKISGRHGNKGVVSRIMPDDQMPKVDGKPADIIMSPIGVSGRSNLSQVYEVNDGDFNKTREIEYKGRKTRGTGGTQFVMRINQIAEKKLLSNSDKMTQDKHYKTRFGEMESILLTTNQNRLEILDYLKHQEQRDNEQKVMNTLHAIGVDMRGVE